MYRHYTSFNRKKLVSLPSKYTRLQHRRLQAGYRVMSSRGDSGATESMLSNHQPSRPRKQLISIHNDVLCIAWCTEFFFCQCVTTLLLTSHSLLLATSRQRLIKFVLFLKVTFIWRDSLTVRALRALPTLPRRVPRRNTCEAFHVMFSYSGLA